MLSWLFSSILIEIRKVLTQMAHLQETIDAVKKEVGELKTVNASARTLLDKLFTMVEKAQDDPAELKEVLTTLRAEKEALVAQITKNTPAEETPPPEASRRRS